MEAQTQDASQNRFSWKRPSGRGGPEHRLREVASVCRLPRGKRLHLPRRPQCSASVSPKVTPVQTGMLSGSPLPWAVVFQGSRRGSWGHRSEPQKVLPRCSPHSTRYVEQTTALWAQRSLYQKGGNNGSSLQRLTGVGGYPTQQLCSIKGSRAVTFHVSRAHGEQEVIPTIFLSPLRKDPKSAWDICPLPGNTQTVQAWPAGRRPLSLAQGNSELQGQIIWALRPQPYRRHQLKRPLRTPVIPLPSAGSQLPTHPPPRLGHAYRGCSYPPGSTAGGALLRTHCLAPCSGRKGFGGTILFLQTPE